VLKDEQWERVAPLLLGKAGDPGRTGSDNRLCLEVVLWMVRIGAPWRDLPEAFGSWNSVFRRFRRWAQAGIFERLFQLLSGDPDFEYALIDGTIIRVHQHRTGAKGGLVVRPSGRQIACDFAMYRWRHLIENFFCALKQFRRIAPRYDKTDQSFEAMIYLAASFMALK
jgi:transposase